MFLRRYVRPAVKFVRTKHYQHILVHPEIQYAMRHEQPVVALESTIITHGMPMPENVTTALQVEEQVRQHGAIPATIGIIDGCIRVGLTKEELTALAKKPRNEVIKCSRRDLPYVVAKGQSGGTTVAATMIVAHRVGIKVFATGGIGGVHREGHVSMDVSADLTELGRTPVAVVCSGVKSILDIPRTLEYLETQGVCVASYDSPGGVFPDFYTRDSGCRAAYDLATPKEAADLLRSWRELKLTSGVLIGVPIPEEFAADKGQMEAAIKAAVVQALSQGVSGKEVTPFLLAAIAKITQGSSLQANIALIKNNAKVAAQIAAALAGGPARKQSEGKEHLKKPLVVGASILDLSFTVDDQKRDMKLDGATYSAVAKQAAGGVGRNIAEGIYKLYGDVNLISAVGKDQMGQTLLQLMPKTLQRGMIQDESQATSLCSLIFDKFGDCKLILGNMEIHQCSITPETLQAHQHLFRDAPLIIMDSNISEQAMECTLRQAQKYQLPVFFEPTDMFIAGKPFHLSADLTQHIRLIKPNLHELKTIVEAITGQTVDWQPDTKVDRVQLLQQTKQLLQKIESRFNCIIATLGDHGVLLSFRSDAATNASCLLDATTSQVPPHITRFYAAPIVPHIVNVSGAGDSFCAGFITALLQGRILDECVAAGFVAAERALQSESAVPATYFSNAHAFEDRYKQTLKTLQQQSI
ncbi:pseudouridine-metabolizing bifunctional protein C1861.05 [Drosophila guanche]|uniref:Blast:Pseudouridine-5'-phosphate glycosidase n=1 Tax=Drosophila guanche TaxID=7266 RepID=A0A3B0JHG4_DROGU|nr:pseudouridine-metabolizing bifunctional protein C1861.05 [Drosophila guanche]SPP79732.1 blast:Pseudouridine-5'-phosphate glycosidase [Drosophila guanche]